MSFSEWAIFILLFLLIIFIIFRYVSVGTSKRVLVESKLAEIPARINSNETIEMVEPYMAPEDTIKLPMRSLYARKIRRV